MTNRLTLSRLNPFIFIRRGPFEILRWLKITILTSFRPEDDALRIEDECDMHKDFSVYSYFRHDTDAPLHDGVITFDFHIIYSI